MRILVFSDSHLFHRFDNNKYKLLERIISSADRVIINGDFWDGYLTDFNRFMRSPWKKLFPLLKSKKTVYLFGNHDKKEYSDKRTSLFSDVQTHQYRLTLNGTTYIFEHGNRLFPVIDEQINNRLINGLLSRTLRSVGFILMKLMRMKVLQRLHKKTNSTIRERAHKELKTNEVIVFGHTHSPELNLKRQYMNSGFIEHGWGHYIILEGKNITLHEEEF